MKELLEEYNYKQGDYDYEWYKEQWTIRLFDDEMEAFNTPRINTPGKYYKCESTKENLLEVLNDIEKFIK